MIFFTAISTSYFNSTKKEGLEIYDNIVDNVYFKKTLTHIVKNLEPKYKKVKHKIKTGETFDKILENYLIPKKERIRFNVSKLIKDQIN